MATQEIKDILDAEIPSPAHAHKPTAASPVHSDWYFSRSGPAWGFGYSDGHVKKFGDQTPRISGLDQGLVINGNGSDNLVNNPLDPSAENPESLNVTKDNLRLGEDRWVLTPTGSNNTWHRIRYNVNLNDGQAFHSSFLVKRRGGRYVAIEHLQSDGTDNKFPRAYFDLRAGETGTVSNPKAQVLAHDITEVAEGWYLIYFATQPYSGWSNNNSFFEIVNSDGGRQYTADGSNTIEMVGQQVGPRGEAPHLNFGGTVNGETVDIFQGGQPSWYNPFNTTVYCEFELLSPGITGNQGIIEGGNSAGQMYIRRDGRNEFTVRNFDSSNGSYSPNKTFSAFERVRAASGQFNGTKRVAANGEVAEGPGLAQLFNVSTLRLASNRGGCAVRVYDVRVFGRLLTAQEMRTLTA